MKGRNLGLNKMLFKYYRPDADEPDCKQILLWTDRVFHRWLPRACNHLNQPTVNLAFYTSPASWKRFKWKGGTLSTETRAGSVDKERTQRFLFAMLFILEKPLWSSEWKMWAEKSQMLKNKVYSAIFCHNELHLFGKNKLYKHFN